jgi:hypothetical protein
MGQVPPLCFVGAIPLHAIMEKQEEDETRES